MFWGNKKSSKKDDPSSSLLPGNAEAKNSANKSTSSSFNQQQPKGLLNRAVRRMGSQMSSKPSPILPTHSSGRAHQSIGNQTKRPLHKHSAYKPYSSYPGRATPGVSPCNNFLLGGTYYPGKDNRRRINHRAQRRTLWYRIFLSSPLRVFLTILVTLYVLRNYIYAPIAQRIFAENNEFIKSKGMKMPLEDSKIAKEVLESVGSVREKLGKFKIKPNKSPHGHLSTSKLDAIQKIVPEWSHRNDISPTLNDNEKSKNKIKPSEKNEDKQEEEEISQKNEHANEQRRINDVPKKDQNPNPSSSTFIQKLDDGIMKEPIRTLQNLDSSGTCPDLTNDSEMSVTLVIQSTPDRLWLVEETCHRWTDPITLVVYNNTDNSNWEQFFDWQSNCPQITILSVQAPPDSNSWEYPVNKLRNIGLDAIQTTHFLVLDVDFVPSATLQTKIHEHLMQAASKDLEALVVPAFQREGEPPCQNMEECHSFLKDNSEFLPSAFEELKHCVQEENCAVFQSHDNVEGHYTTNSERWLQGDWYEDKEDNKETSSQMPISIPCIHSYRYEPYLVLRWCPNRTPYYDERFYGYGKNKIQYVAHLRFSGYSFRILPEGFIIHNPHHESEAKKTWNDVDGNDLHFDMDKLYPKFLGELKSKYGHPKVPTCGQVSL